MEKLLRDRSVVLAGHAVSYDFAVICAERPELLDLVFQAHADNRVRDTDMRERLIAIAQGTFAEDRDVAYSLETLAWQRLKIKLDKSTYRLKYGSLINVPITQWEPGAVTYAADDARATLKVFRSQAEECDDYCLASSKSVDGVHGVHHEDHACRKAWALMLMRCHGVRTDGEDVDALEHNLLGVERGLMADLVEAKILEKHKKNNSYTAKKKVIQARVEATFTARGLPAPTTDASTKFPNGQIKTDAETCEDSGDPILEKYSAYVGNDKILGTYVPALKAGARYPVNAWWNAQLVSDRTSCSGPNWQNPPRAEGVRECVIPDYEGALVYSSTDYATIELVALADFTDKQFGNSKMAQRIREGMDLHTALAARILSISYEDAKANKSRPDVKHARNLAKAIGFGFPGGLGADTFVKMSKKGYGLTFTTPEARSYKALYLSENPEMVKFFNHISALCASGYGTVTIPGSGMVRGGCTYTAAANTHFQSPVAYGATMALFEISWQCYVRARGSILFGSRPQLFIHDEVICSHPAGIANECALQIQKVMEEQMQKVLTSVPVKAEPCLMTRWTKSAEPQFNSQGELVPWVKPSPSASHDKTKQAKIAA